MRRVGTASRLMLATLVPALALVLAVAWRADAQTPGAATPAASTVRTTPMPPVSEVWLVRVDFDGQRAINSLASQYDVWEVHYATPPAQGRWALLYVNAVETERLRLAGYAPQLRLDDDLQAADAQGFLCGTTTIASFPCYRTLAETTRDLEDLAQTYPALAEWIDIGDSWEKATGAEGSGSDLQVLVVTNREKTVPKFRFLVMGAIHARELATAETATRFAEMLVKGYGVDPDITWLLDYGEAHILAQANPDGRLRAESGYCWRKNTNDTYACPIAYTQQSGIDLNRNFAFRWNQCTYAGCSSSDACSLVYRGESAASEPEVQAMQAYLTSIFADQRGPALEDAAPDDAEGLLISLHSYGGLVLFPWGWTDAATPNHAQLQMLADKMGYITGYRACATGAPGCLYNTDGTTDDWLYGELGVPAYTIEMGDNFFQSCTTYESTMVDDLLATLRYAFKAARRPYQTPAGPEPVNLSVSATSVRQGEPITLTATLDTTRHDSNGYAVGANVLSTAGAVVTTTTVLSATWYLNAPSWVTDSVGVPMLALDGALDAPVEDVYAVVDTSALSPGCYLLLVEGADDTGQVGVPSAVGVEVTAQIPIAPTPQPNANQAGCWQNVAETKEQRFMPLMYNEGSSE